MRTLALACALLCGGCTDWRSVPTRTGARGETYPNARLVTQDGAPVRFYDDIVQGQRVLVYFAYTQCRGSCPGTTRNLLRVMELLDARGAGDVRLVTVSLDGDNDTPAAMRRFMELHGGHPRWTFVSGDEEELEAVRRRLGFVDPDPVIDADRTQHAAMVLFGNDATGRWAATAGQARPEVIAASAGRILGAP